MDNVTIGRNIKLKGEVNADSTMGYYGYGFSYLNHNNSCEAGTTTDFTE